MALGGMVGVGNGMKSAAVLVFDVTARRTSCTSLAWQDSSPFHFFLFFKDNVCGWGRTGLGATLVAECNRALQR